MFYTTGQTVRRSFPVSDLSGPINADSAPSGVLVKNGSATGTTVTITHPPAVTGKYEATFAMPTAVAGDTFELQVTTVVGAVTQPVVIIRDFQHGVALLGALGLASGNLDTQFGNLPTATGNAEAVRDELETELGRLDAAISTRLASASITLTSGKVTPVDVDGLGFAAAQKIILAFASGKVAVASLGGGVYRMSFKAQDGTTEVFTMDFNPVTGARP